MSDELREQIAIGLFVMGMVPNCTLFIDEDTLSYGYGGLDGGLGLWQYQIPSKIKSKSIKEEYYN